MVFIMTEGDRSVSRDVRETPFRPGGYIASMYKQDLHPSSRASLAGAEYAGTDQLGRDTYNLVFAIPVPKAGSQTALVWRHQEPVTLHVRGSQAHRDQLRERLLRAVNAS
jgi:hypothetical protein